MARYDARMGSVRALLGEVLTFAAEGVKGTDWGIALTTDPSAPQYPGGGERKVRG